MKLLREYIRVLIEQEQGSKGSLVVVDIQPEYESNTPFDIGDMLRTAADSYSRVLFLYNGPDLGMIDESGLRNFYAEKLDYDEEAIDELLSKSKFFDKGYGFFRDVMDSDLCFDRSSIIKIVKYMIDNGYRDIRDLEEEDIEAIGISELLFDDLEDYGFYIPDLEEVLPNWSGSDIAGGARNECLAEVEILGAALGLSFNQVDNFIYEGDNRYTKTLTESVLLETAGQQLMVPAKILGSDSGEYRTEPHWQDFHKLPKEEQMAWAEEHFDGGIRKPLRVRVYADGALMFSDGHHRAKAAMLLDEMIPIVISRNQLQEKSDELWEYWLDLVLQGLHPKYDLNPEGYNIRTLEDAKELTGR